MYYRINDFIEQVWTAKALLIYNLSTIAISIVLVV